MLDDSAEANKNQSQKEARKTEKFERFALIFDSDAPLPNCGVKGKPPSPEDQDDIKGELSCEVWSSGWRSERRRKSSELETGLWRQVHRKEIAFLPLAVSLEYGDCFILCHP